jgi:L-iditol 2-dehydrogenase
VTTDGMAGRRELARHFGALESFDPKENKLDASVRSMTAGRGADIVIVAASAPGIVEQAVACSRPGARILLFAQTSHQERIEVSGAAICMEERTLCGAYSASVDLQKESAELVFSGALPVEELISHRFPLSRIQEGIERALHPADGSLKIVVQPQR